LISASWPLPILDQELRLSFLMERTVRTHIEALELILRQLNDELMEQDDLRLRNTLEARVRAANQALEYYRAALALEERARHD
jgi:hypothetical protein